MKVIVVGAYGFTGKLVCQQLNSENISFAVAGRDTVKLKQLATELDAISKIITTDITTKKGVEPILDYDIIINCIGPFQLYSDQILEQAVTHSKCYFDITGEEVFVSESIDKYSQIAVDNKATIVHAAAFESALVNVLTHLLVQKHPDIIGINTYYHFEKSKPSPGTRFTMKLSKYSDSFFIIDGKKVAISDLEDTKPKVVKIRDENYFTMPYPMPEIPLIYEKFGINNIASYLLTDAFSATMSFTKREAQNSMGKEIEKFQNRKPKGPTAAQRKVQYFDVLVEGFTEKGAKSQFHLSGTDMYLVTAKTISFLVKEQLKKPTKNYGILSPHELLIGKENEFFNYISNININHKQLPERH